MLPNTHFSPNRSKNTSQVSGKSKHQPKLSADSSAKHSEILVYQISQQSPSDGVEDTSNATK